MTKDKSVKWGLKNKVRSRLKPIYGPVFSWRLGRSLGIDLLSTKEKTCSFDCIYCQLGKTVNLTTSRQKFISTSRILEELKKFPKVEIDYLTFSGMGEPTLAANLGEVIKGIKKISSLQIAILTNSSLISLEEVRSDLSLADFVIAKLDAPDEVTLYKINCPVKSINLEGIIKGLYKFKEIYKGKLALQILFSQFNINKSEALANLVREINPDEVQLNTPLRPSPVKPLSMEKMDDIRKTFVGVKAIYVYDFFKIALEPVSLEETLKRRPVL